MANVLPQFQQINALRLLVEGNSIRSIARLTQIHPDTIASHLVRFGTACQTFLDAKLRDLNLRHLECDEIWTFVRKKQARLHAEEQNRSDIGDMYLWVAQDMDSKLVPTFLVGKRSADNARRFMCDLAGRLKVVNNRRIVIQLSTDAFAGYAEAVDLAFVPYVNYGQIIKNYRNAEQPGRYAAPEMVNADRRAVFGEVALDDICTSHVERNNLTIRTFMKRFARLAVGFSKKLENLKAAVALHFAYFNFCWRPRRPGTSGRRRLTPAMAAGVADRLWTFEDLFLAVTG